MNTSSEYAKKVMDDLDALLADLQQSTAHITTPQTGPRAAHIGSTTSPRNSSGGRASQTPPPLPPPPQDIPDTIPNIPPPQQFGDHINQPLYEAQSIKPTSSNQRLSGQGSSDGSGDQGYYIRDHPPSQPQPGMSMISNNLSELDQLLNDLNSAQFMAEVDKKQGQPAKMPPPVAPKPGRGGGGTSVDNLLDQLENSVPASPASGPHGGYPVQQTSTVNYSYRATQDEPQSPAYNYNKPQQSSAATQELDDLMSNLSDFKKEKGVVGQVGMPPPPRSPSPGSEPSYAKPHKSRNLSQNSSANSSMQSSSITANMSGSSVQGSSVQGGQLESMLGDLQSDLSRQGVNTKTKGLCAACNQPVVGQVITALGKIWHIEHFSCDHCHETLGTKNFYERDGVAYCEKDYHSLFAPRCGYCNGPIIDKCVTALNNTWHPEHFFCAQCGRPFGDDGFHERDGKAYCKADFFEMFAPKCGGCGRAIVNNYISALNRHWHPECFACWDCHQPFNGGSFFDYEGLPYCETHYHAKKGSLCAGCQAPITGRCITAMYKKFHPEHFVCAFCLKQLNKGTFKEQNDRPYCHPCFVKLFG